MKRKMKMLAVLLAAAMLFSAIPVNAATLDSSAYSIGVSAYSFADWWNNLWGKGKGKSKNTDKNNSSDATTEETKETAAEETITVETGETGSGTGSSVTLLEDDTTVAEGTVLRASTYVLDSGVNALADTTTLKYFPVTLYNYDKTTINNATHQVEVDNGLGNTWNGIYFNDGNPSAESYTYTSGEVSYTSTTVDYESNNNYNTYINNGYYVDVNGTKYLVTGLSCTRSGYIWHTYSWTITYAGGTATSSDSSITLYQAGNSSATTARLSYAAWNFWNKKNAGNNDYGQYTYSGLVGSKLDANKNITFTKPDGGIFNSDASVKDIYTNVEIPFVYENGTYTFDASQNGAYFYADSTQGSTAAQSNGRLYFNEGKAQSNGGNYGDGSTTVWMPFNSTQSISGEANCDYHFGMAATIPFTMTANGKMNPNDDKSEDITFSFSGDDDVWIFIDGQLVIDLGGIHNRLDATINFAENTWSISESNTSDVAVADYNDAAISGTIFNDGDTTGTLNQTRETFAATDSHELTIFYLERGAGSSNCKIQFNLPMKDIVSVTKRATQSISSDGTLSPLTAKEQETVNNIDFGFTLTKNGKAVANTNYNLINANGQVVSTPSTDANGHFTLRNGQTARFIGEIVADGAEYQVVEDAVEAIGFKLPTYTYSGTAAGGYTVSGTSYSEGSAIPATKENLTSAAVTAKGSTEAEDSLQFICENYFDANLPNPSSRPVDDTIVIDYGLSVVIDALANDVYRGDTIELTDVTGAQYGTAEIVDGKIKYQLTKQLTGVEVLTYTAKVTSSDGENSGEAKVYIIPATSMYYEENFEGLVDFTTGDWSVEGTSQTDPQEPGVVGTVGDSPYGSDAAYKNDGGDSNGSSKYVSTAGASASFRYTFTGTGTSFFARTTNNSGYMRVVITDQAGTPVYTGYRDTSYKTDNSDTTLYNIPVFTFDGDNYGTYTVTVTIANSDGTKYGSKFWLDGIRIIKPLNSTDSNVSIANAAYASDGEANMTVATLRTKLIGEAQIKEDGSLSWNGEDFVVFTDTNDQITTVEEYSSNGPKEEVYLNNGQSITFSLKKWNTNSNKIYLGIKAPSGSGSVNINGNVLAINNAADCYYDISNYAQITTEEDGSKIATFKIQAGSSLISVTNIKVTGETEFTIVNQTDINGDENTGEEVDILSDEPEETEQPESNILETDQPADTPVKDEPSADTESDQNDETAETETGNEEEK